jgi:replicative DNA helicase
MAEVRNLAPDDEEALIERGLPAAVDAERSILGGILLDADRYNEVESLGLDNFALDSHRRIFRRMVDLAATGRPIDIITLQEELSRHKELGSIGGMAYLASLTDGVPRRPSIEHYVRMVRDKAILRRLVHTGEALAAAAADPIASPTEIANEFGDIFGGVTSEGTGRIRGFDDVPDIMSMEVEPVEWVVDRIAARKMMTLWAGVDGTAKTFLMHSMAIAVGGGGDFLGRRCRKTPVLVMDYENGDSVVRDRLDLIAGGPLADVKFWGMWLDPQPPPIGSEVLLKIAKETQPLMIFDPLRYAHAVDENDSTEMVAVMRHLRSYATAGAAVVILHHPAKAEGSTGRGSSAIRGACDIAWLQELNEEGLIILKCGKNRGGDKPTITIQPDFEAGRFRVTDSPAWSRQQEEIRKLYEIITIEAGLSTNQIIAKAGMMRTKATRLLKEQTGRLWKTAPGSRNSVLYFPLVLENPDRPSQGELTCSRAEEPAAAGKGESENVPTLLGGEL